MVAPFRYIVDPVCELIAVQFDAQQVVLMPSPPDGNVLVAHDKGELQDLPTLLRKHFPLSKEAADNSRTPICEEGVCAIFRSLDNRTQEPIGQLAIMRSQALSASEEAHLTRWVQIATEHLECAHLSKRNTFLEAEVRAMDQAEQTLRRSEEILSRVLDASPSIVVVEDRQGRLTLVNRQFEVVFDMDREDVYDKPLEQFMPTELAEKLRRTREEVMEKDALIEMETEFPVPEGVRLYHCVKFPLRGPDGMPESVVTTATDVTEKVAAEKRQQKLEDHVRESQKLDALGRMAGGIAHDFNNQLAVIMNLTDLLISQQDPDRAREDLREIQRSAARAAQLTRKLTVLGRRNTARPEDLDPVDAMRRMQPILEQMLGGTVRLEIELGSIGHIRLDPAQFDEVIVNLALNAQEACEEDGNIRIGVSNQTIEDSEAPVLAGEYVVIVVEDNGNGMDPATAARAFEPFFTTKADGASAGLGLSIVYSIVTKAGGYVELDSQPHEGTTVTLYFPRQEAPEDTEESSGPRPTMERARILLVEDEPGVLRALVRILGIRHDLVTATNALEALELQQDEGPFDLLITDVVMPGLSGFQLARKLQSVQPDLPVIYMSGYSEEAVAGEDIPRDQILHKPFSSRELLRLVEERLKSS